MIVRVLAIFFACTTAILTAVVVWLVAPQRSALVEALSTTIDWTADTWTAFGTVVTAIFTAVLGLFTISVARSTRIAAKAADLSARAAIAIDLPHIMATAAKLATGVEQDATGRKRYQCSVNELRFSNHGRTKASLVEVQFGLSIGSRLPKKPVYRYTKTFPVNTILNSDPKAVEEVVLHQYDFEAPPDLYDQLRTYSTSLWFYCNLVYRDFMQTRHEVGFCWKQHATSGMGVLIEDATPAYNKRI